MASRTYHGGDAPAWCGSQSTCFIARFAFSRSPINALPTATAIAAAGASREGYVSWRPLHLLASHANISAPAGVNRTKVPRSRIVSHPRSMHSFMPAPYSAGLPLSLNKNGPLINSMWMRPSCTGSTVLAISSIRRAAFSGSA